MSQRCEETAAACAQARAGATRRTSTVGDVPIKRRSSASSGEVVERFGRLDCAVANAGQSIDALLLRLKRETIDHAARRQPQVGVLSLRRGRTPDDEAALGLDRADDEHRRHDRERRPGRLRGRQGRACIGLAKSLAKELGSRNIRVNAVAPGLIETAMTEKMPEAAREYFDKQAALGRPGSRRMSVEWSRFCAPTPPGTSPVKRSWSTAAS